MDELATVNVRLSDFERCNADLDRLESENEKLRELVRDMWRDGMCDCDECGACAQCEYHYPDRMRELGIEIEVDDD